MSDEVCKGRACTGIPKNVGGSIKREHMAAFDLCQAMKVAMAYSYIRRECPEASVLSTAALDCCNSGMLGAAERLTELRCCFLDIGSGSFNSPLSILLTETWLTRTIPVGTAFPYR
jgi:hypothetical protein